MLGGKEAMATVAVRDLQAAKKFYEGTLGLRQTDAQEQEAVTYQAGAAKLLVYRSQFAGSNKATAVTWLLGREVEKVVKGLRSKGVTFEHYQHAGPHPQGRHSRGSRACRRPGSRTPTATFTRWSAAEPP